MAWTKLELAQLARDAGEQAVRAAMGGALGASQRASSAPRQPSLGSKNGIPNWNCRCGAKANFGTRPTCRDCGAEAPKRILKLQATKSQQGGGTPANTPPSTPRANLSSTPGTPNLRPSTPRQTGINSQNAAAQNGAWGTVNGARRVHWGDQDPPADAPAGVQDDPAQLRTKLTGLRQTLQTAKNANSDKDLLDNLEARIADTQAKLDATRPKDARLQSLLDRKKGLTAKLAAADTRVSKAKEELEAAEAEHAAAAEGLSQVEAKLEEAFREQSELPSAVAPKTEDALICKAFDDATKPEERTQILKALEALQYTALQAQERFHLLRPPPPPPQPAAGTPEADAAEADAKVARLEAAMAKAKAEQAARKEAVKAAEAAKLADEKAKKAQQEAEGKPEDSPERQAAKKAAEEAAESEAKRARTAKQAEQAAQEAAAAQQAMEVDPETPDAAAATS